MTREEFIAKYERECSYYFDGYYAPCIQEFLNQIYDNFEEAMKPKTCDGCVRQAEDMQDLHCAFCSRSCDDKFEPKE